MWIELYPSHSAASVIVKILLLLVPTPRFNDERMMKEVWQKASHMMNMITIKDYPQNNWIVKFPRKTSDNYQL